MKPKILVITGPTASGKTSLALKVAGCLPTCTIISVDARQSYKDLSILTGKDIPTDLPNGTKIYGTDLLDSSESTNIATFVKRIRPIIQENIDNKIPVILVGGSGLYLKALTQDLDDINIPPSPLLRKKLELYGLEELQAELKKMDAQLLDSLNNSDRNNPRRLIRHIEKILGRTKRPSSKTLIADFLWIGLSLSKEKQLELIERRVKERMTQGVIDEVKNILANHPDEKQPLFTSLGLKEIKSYLHHDFSREELIKTWVKSEMDYARRQMVWFKKQPSIIWYDESKDRDSLARELSENLKQNEQ